MPSEKHRSSDSYVVYSDGFTAYSVKTPFDMCVQCAPVMLCLFRKVFDKNVRQMLSNGVRVQTSQIHSDQVKRTKPNRTKSKIPNEWINRIAITTILWRIKNELFQKCMRVRQNRIMFVFSRHEIDIPFAIPARCCVQCSSLSLSLLPLCQSCSQRTQQTHRTIRFKVRVYFILIRETVQLPKRKMR